MSYFSFRFFYLLCMRFNDSSSSDSIVFVKILSNEISFNVSLMEISEWLPCIYKHFICNGCVAVAHARKKNCFTFSIVFILIRKKIRTAKFIRLATLCNALDILLLLFSFIILCHSTWIHLRIYAFIFLWGRSLVWL